MPAEFPEGAGAKGRGPGRTGWHHRGRFEDREGFQNDRVSLDSLPVLIQTWLAAHHAIDTLVKAAKTIY
ncbi:MAG: hypothetical protein ACXVBR_17610 [Flavisolibacter sp.]